jgi:hypothetical protein
MDPANLSYTNVPILNGRPPDAATVGLVFGVVLVAFFGHTSVANASKLILTRDPTGRSLLWGNLAALTTVIALYCLAVVAILGALGPDPLVATRGTAITPLADAVGPLVNILGSVYVVLAIGLGSIYVTLGVYNQVIEIIRSPGVDPAGVLGRLGAERRTRLIAGLAPAFGIVVVLEILLALDADWFAGPIGYVGVLAVPLVGGVFPMLLVAAARRKGEYVPGRILGLIGQPVTVVVIGGIFLAGVFLHGLVIWQEPVPRIAAILVGVLTVALVLRLFVAGRFRPRSIVEVRLDETGRGSVSVTSEGRQVQTEQAVPGSAGRGHPLRSVTVALEPGGARELRIWSHQVSADGWSSAVPARTTIVRARDGEGDPDFESARGAAAQEVEPSATDPILVPLDGTPVHVTVQLQPSEGTS